jgi:hypothetical protein
VLRPVTEPASLWKLPSGREPVRRPVGKFLHLLLAIEQEHHRTFVTRQEFLKWGVSEEELFRLAFQNIEGARGALREDGCIEVRGELAASLLVLPGFLKRFFEKPVAIVPVDGLIVVGMEQQGEALLREAWDLWRREGRPVSPCLYGDGGEVILGEASEKARGYLAGSQYQVLQERLSEQGVRLADFRLIRREGHWLSSCRLESGALLPEVELVEVEGRFLRWEELEVEAVGTWPECWRVK